MITIFDLSLEHKKWIEQINEMLVESFGEGRKGKWLTDINKTFKKGRFSLVAVNDKSDAVGWIGGISQYSGNVWELHPLVTKKEERGKGIGSLLVKKFERKVAELGGITVWLGADDENNSTSLSDKDIYHDLLRNIQDIKNLKNHPYQFYQKLGYSIVGVLPDANGFGKPDIFMAKRVNSRKS